jgi:hypothetical protein
MPRRETRVLKREDLVAALAQQVPSVLARELVDNFLLLRQDVTTGTLGRASPGKFVETYIQILQYLEAGQYDEKPDVDRFLRGLDGRASSLDDGLRICGARIARAMYALRSKRNVVHKGAVDPNSYDLRFLHHGAQWVVAELIRTTSQIPMEMAGSLVDFVQAPAGGLIEDFGDRKLVLEKMTARPEMLALLHSYYPGPVQADDLRHSMDRFAKKTVNNTLRQLWADKLVQGNAESGYRLTRLGFDAAIEVLTRYSQPPPPR